jgi:hypothetical protein
MSPDEAGRAGHEVVHRGLLTLLERRSYMWALDLFAPARNTAGPEQYPAEK